MTVNQHSAPSPVRVAIVGAGGIGKHHAKWWALEGANVCAFVGRSEESVACTAKALEDLFGFRGRAYTSLQTMLDQERPDIVDVCTPPPCHFEHVRAALSAGCHVLCEKPFVHAPGLSRDVVLAKARELARLAAGKGLRLGVCTQYSMGGRIFSEIWDKHHPSEPIVHYHGHLESPAKNRPPDPARVWVDLSPHLISVMLKTVPGGCVIWETLATKFEGYEASATFDVRGAAGEIVHCWIVTRNALQPPLNIRHFKYNGYAFTIEGQNDADGVYCSRIDTPDGSYVRPDLMRLLIRDFAAGNLAATIEESLTNVDIMMGILEAAGCQA